MAVLCYDGKVKIFPDQERSSEEDIHVVEVERMNYSMRLEEFESIQILKSKIPSPVENVEFYHIAFVSYYRENYNDEIAGCLRFLSVAI